MTAVALTTASCSLDENCDASCSMSAVVTVDGTGPTCEKRERKTKNYANANENMQTNFCINAKSVAQTNIL